MKNTKILPVLIIVISLVVIAIALVIFNIIGAGDGNNQTEQSKLTTIKPELELELNTAEKDQEKVIINISATTDDELGIEYILLPNKKKVFSTEKQYEVIKNGTYEFKAVGNNGQEHTLSIEVTNIKEVSASDPYIPEGFNHVEGEIEEGFIIQDQYGNQYVWVPVDTGILARTTMMNSEYEETDGLATSLVNSVAKNYGFYIARYEACAYENQGNYVAATIEGQIPWTNVTYQDAYIAAERSAEIFGYTDVSTALVSSYAWDTTLEWLNKSVTNYSSNTSYGNYSGTLYPTGTTQSDKINNICDMAGNVREWTTEIYKDLNAEAEATSKREEIIINRVVRGGSATINKIANSRNGYPENLTDGYWGFRTVLYKNN